MARFNSRSNTAWKLLELSNVLTHHLRTIMSINQQIKSESEILLKIFHRFLLRGSDDEERRRAATKNGEHSLYKSNGENGAESKYEIVIEETGVQGAPAVAK